MAAAHRAHGRDAALVRRSPTTAGSTCRNIDELINERTKVVSLTWVSNMLGTVNPVAEIARRAHEVGAVGGRRRLAGRAADAGRRAGASGADFVAFTGHKVVGPTGIGVLWGRCDLLDAAAAVPRRRRDDRDRDDGAVDVRRDRRTGSRPAPRRSSRRSVSARPSTTCRRSAWTTSRAHEQAITGVRARGAGHRVRADRARPAATPSTAAGRSPSSSTAIHPHDVSQVLDSRGIAVRAGHHCARPAHERFGVQSSTRASSYLYTTPAEIDALVEGLEYTKKYFKVDWIMDLEALYQEIILDHYRNPHHSGLREPVRGRGAPRQPDLRRRGDPARAPVRHGDDAVVEDVSYDAEGCSISQASTSVMTDLVIGKPLDRGAGRAREFLTLMQGRGEVEPDEERAGGRHRVRRRRQVPGPRQVRAAVLDGVEGRDRPQIVAADRRPSRPTRRPS